VLFVEEKRRKDRNINYELKRKKGWNIDFEK
jgi:hypothetical protein